VRSAVWTCFLVPACDGGGQTEGDDDTPTDSDSDTDLVGDTDFEPTTTSYESSTLSGFVTMTSGEVPAAGPANTFTAVSAGFLNAEGKVEECVRRQLTEDCVDLSCEVISVGGFVGVSAGTIDLVGLLQPIQLVEIYEGLYGGFFVPTGPSYYTPGQDVTVTASGGDVPAFSLTTPAPNQNLTLIEPDRAPGSTQVTLPAATDIRYTWAPTDLGAVTVSLYVLQPPPTLRSIQCSRLGTPLVNETIVPLAKAAEFAEIPAALESVTYTSTVLTVAGAYPVTFELSSPVITQTGELYQPRTILFE